MDNKILGKRLVIIILIGIFLLLSLSIGGYYGLKYFYRIYKKQESALKPSQQKIEQPKAEQPKTEQLKIKQLKTEQSKTEPPYPYTLVAYTGQVFGAKIPKGWKVTDTESGIDILDPQDSNTGAAGAIAVGWFGSQTPDSFIDFMLKAIGAADVNYENESAQEEIKDPTYGLTWVMKTKIFTFSKGGQRLKAKASAGVLNGYGQFMGMLTAFQTTPDQWGKWAPALERIAKSITIINSSKAGGIDKVRLPTAADLANDSSPLMESWEYRNKVGDWSSHEWSDAILGQESDLYSPSTGQSYTRPLDAYDPTVGGYRNPDKSSEILVDPYAR